MFTTRRFGLAVLATAALATPAAAQAAADHHDHAAMTQAAPAQPAAAAQPAAPAAACTPAAPRNPALPAPEEGAKAAIESSPRHGEWAEVKVPAATRR